MQNNIIEQDKKKLKYRIIRDVTFLVLGIIFLIISIIFSKNK